MIMMVGVQLRTELGNVLCNFNLSHNGRGINWRLRHTTTSSYHHRHHHYTSVDWVCTATKPITRHTHHYHHDHHHTPHAHTSHISHNANHTTRPHDHTTTPHHHTTNRTTHTNRHGQIEIEITGTPFIAAPAVPYVMVRNLSEEL